jgi:hypothetical protein
MIFLHFGKLITSDIFRWQTIQVQVDGKEGALVWFSARIEPYFLKGLHELSIREGLDEKFDFGICEAKPLTASTHSHNYNAFCFTPVPSKEQRRTIAQLNEEDK